MICRVSAFRGGRGLHGVKKYKGDGGRRDVLSIVRQASCVRAACVAQGSAFLCHMIAVLRAQRSFSSNATC